MTSSSGDNSHRIVVVVHCCMSPLHYRIFDLRGVPAKLINLMSELYSGTESAVRCGDTISDLFPVVSGVRQGSVLDPTPFSACMNWNLRSM